MAIIWGKSVLDNRQPQLQQVSKYSNVDTVLLTNHTHWFGIKNATITMPEKQQLPLTLGFSRTVHTFLRVCHPVAVQPPVHASAAGRLLWKRPSADGRRGTRRQSTWCERHRGQTPAQKSTRLWLRTAAVMKITLLMRRQQSASYICYWPRRSPGIFLNFKI